MPVKDYRSITVKIHKKRMDQALFQTNYTFKNQTGFYRGKVREVYEIDKKYLLIIATDRISAFDHILKHPVPQKGAILNMISALNLKSAESIIPTWLIDSPHPYFSIGRLCKPVAVEMVIRGYLCGHALREYEAGKRILCGAKLPEGLKPYERFPEPVITPTTKASEGHDMDITPDEIVERGLVTASEYDQLAEYTRKLFLQGQQEAKKKGLILADTKYEFGRFNGRLMLIDEIHTPDSSRFFLADDHELALKEKRPPEQLSKEFARQWLIEQGFDGQGNQEPPEMPDEVINSIRKRYINLYETFTGKSFDYDPPENPEADIQKAAEKALRQLENNSGL